ncbi:MAG: hypothetical protein ABEN55_17580, partial [Bradymonadaceae bacterium]
MIEPDGLGRMLEEDGRLFFVRHMFDRREDSVVVERREDLELTTGSLLDTFQLATTGAALRSKNAGSTDETDGDVFGQVVLVDFRGIEQLTEPVVADGPVV